MKIQIISGSPHKNSISFRVAKHLHQLLQHHPDHEVELLDVRDYPLTPVQDVWKNMDDVPEQWKPLVEKMFGAEGFILVSPEHNGSYTAALKNLFDYFPKQAHKPFGIVTASPGAMGGMRATQQMQLFTAALFGILSPYMLVVPQVDKKFDEEGNLLDEKFQRMIDTFLREYFWLAEKLKPQFAETV